MALNVALGTTNTTAHINVAANTASSSFLPMKVAHERAAPWAHYVGREEVWVTTLDDIVDTYCSIGTPFLKMDVQGYEQHVLEGAKLSLHRLQGIQLEMSLLPLYEGAWVLSEALHYFEREGFELVTLEPGFSDRSTGRLLQADGVFMRSTGTP